MDKTETPDIEIRPDVLEQLPLEDLTPQTRTTQAQRDAETQFTTLKIRGGPVVLSHFTPVIKVKRLSIYISDGTTPNGALPGVTGDICFGADSGKAYKCTTGTTWVAF